MSQPPLTIPKQPALNPAEDYYRLRREGIGFIEQMGSRLWTDYNPHDPGITLLEALCYALTELAYRLGWDIKDLLAPATPAPDGAPPFPDQAFFTARDILTVNPSTPVDFRRLLIDLDPVRNAWVRGQCGGAAQSYYAWCAADALHLGYQPPAGAQPAPQKATPRGIYEVLLELEADPELGDLNDRKLEHSYAFFAADGQLHHVTLELRFPDWELAQPAAWQAFLAGADVFATPAGGLAAHLHRSKTDLVAVADTDLRRHWRDVFYVDFTVPLPGGELLTIANVALRIFGDATAKAETTTAGLQAQLVEATAAGPVPRYRRKLQAIAAAVAEAQATLHAHRNLAEDFGRVATVAVEDVAVCADVDVAPEADIERVQAQIWLAIATYFNPPVRFYTLPELLAEGLPVEDIFNGPALSNGFLKPTELAAAELQTELRTSDLLARLLAIEGVQAVHHLLLTKYDAEGQVVVGAADPTWHDGQPVFAPGQASAAWLLQVSPGHQPRLYYQQSRFLFYKNGLPFVPRFDEALATLTQLRGEADRPKLKNAALDLPAPAGTYRQPAAYFPVQHTLPQTYGVGPAGLPDRATPLRRAQAKQLKAYLLVFEQLLSNALAQVAHTADLFSLSPTVQRTYFGGELSEVVTGYPELVTGLDAARLAALVESKTEFLARRNRFLDHLLARFGEQFTEYALLLTTLQGEQTGQARLLDDKIGFLRAYPQLSHDRGKAFNYREKPCAPANVAGLLRRVSRLLGYPDLSFSWTLSEAGPGNYVAHYELQAPDAEPWLTGEVPLAATSPAAAEQQAYQLVIKSLILPTAYKITPEAGLFRLHLANEAGQALGQSALLPTRPAAAARRDELLAWSSQARALVVEHLLLRPKFPGDALYPACSDGACQTCGAEDPYSFRLTVVLPGWTAPFSENLELRRFADRTVQQELPAHLLGKVCWVGNEGFVENPCADVVNQLADQLLARQARPTAAEACASALAIYAAFSRVFRQWYAGAVQTYVPAAALAGQLAPLFAAQVPPTSIAEAAGLDAALWAELSALLVSYFQEIARTGGQFERFEAAWCAWLSANAAFDWPTERLAARVAALLHANLAGNPIAPGLGSALRARADAILTAYGTDFYDWMVANFAAGRPLAEFSAFAPKPIDLGTGLAFRPGTAATVAGLLGPRYEGYREVSYRLWVVVHLLSELRNTYPGATLHDCDDGSDQNPVRLGSTALGNYPLRRSLLPTDEPPDPT